MSETHMFEVKRVSGNKLTAVLSIIHPDEFFLWVSPGAIASLVQQSAENWSADNDADESHERLAEEAASAMCEVGIHDDCGTESASGLAALNDKAKAFISAVKIGPVRNGKVVGETHGACIFVERVDASEDPRIELEITSTKPEHIAYLTEGVRLQTALVSFGPVPSRTA